MTDTRNTIEIYQTPDDEAQVGACFEQDPVWLLQEPTVVRKSRTTADDGISYNAHHYNLDVVISNGYVASFFGP